MSDWNRIWRAFVTTLLIAAVVATTVGMVCHFHHDRYSTDQCTLCHLVIAPTTVNADACELAPAPAGQAVLSEFFTSRCVADQIPSRAPPA